MKPVDVFDRETQWADLESFAYEPGARLGVVSGRRRTGKSFLLRHLCQQLPGSTYLQAVAEDRGSALARIGDAIAQQVGLTPGSVRPVDWVQAFVLLLQRPGLVVLDEFPYLLEGSSDLLSSLQKVIDEQAFDPNKSTRASVAESKHSGLILCGSSLSTMSSLLSGSQPLRGRAALDLRIEAFDFRSSKEFWGIADHQSAFYLDAALGGAAGYKQLSVASFPTKRSDFGKWVASTLLNPSYALFREDEYLLAEDSEMSSRSLYRSAISALASGERTPTRLGGRLGRDRTSLSHLLGVLQRSGWVRREVDLFNERSVEYEVIDPIIRFSSLVIGPNRARLEEGQGLEVWADMASTWRANIVGPHFETLAREWMAKFASRSTLGGIATKVGRLHLNDRAQRSKVELEACAMDKAGNLLAIGEAKATSDKRTVADIDRLLSARNLAPDSSGLIRLFLFSMNGFTSDAIAKGNAEGVELVDLRRLYEGD